MLPIERQQAIFEYIQTNHSASVTELSRKFFIGETSIRRDLTKLERSGLVRKTYGGAVILQGDNELISLEARQQVEHEAKVIIAAKAASMVHNGNVIFLDSSSTAMFMVPHITKLTNLSVITNSLKIAAALAEHPHIKVYVLGGLLNSRAYSIRGTLTCQMLQGMHANSLFVSPKGVSEDGTLYCADEEEARVRQMMLTLSDQAVLLCNHKKFGQRAAFRLGELQEISAVVCDKTPSRQWCDIIASQGIRLL